MLVDWSFDLFEFFFNVMMGYSLFKIYGGKLFKWCSFILLSDVY